MQKVKINSGAELLDFLEASLGWTTDAEKMVHINSEGKSVAAYGIFNPLFWISDFHIIWKHLSYQQKLKTQFFYYGGDVSDSIFIELLDSTPMILSCAVARSFGAIIPDVLEDCFTYRPGSNRPETNILKPTMSEEDELAMNKIFEDSAKQF